MVDDDACRGKENQDKRQPRHHQAASNPSRFLPQLWEEVRAHAMSSIEHKCHDQEAEHGAICGQERGMFLVRGNNLSSGNWDRECSCNHRSCSHISSKEASKFPHALWRLAISSWLRHPMLPRGLTFAVT